MPTNRDSFGLTVFRNELFLFGGSNHDTQFNDLHIFNTLNGFWKQNNAAIITPRNPLIFISNGSDYILLYGGINVERGEIYNDAYLYIDDEWVEIKEINGAPPKIVGAKAAYSGESLYMFGGEYFEDGAMK
jgi:N-acetylneuraminic acid mutarotase